MTREVVTVGPQASLAEIASLLESRRIKRVPVVDREQVIGIVSRSNLVQALAVQKAAEPAAAQDDDAIRGRLAAELERQPWWRRQVSNVIVADGVVHYWGTYEEDDEREAARVAAENIPGVRGVEDHRLRLRDLPASV